VAIHANTCSPLGIATTKLAADTAFFPMHIAGLLGIPRRVAPYVGDFGWNGLNLVSTVGAFVLAGGVLLFFIDALHTARRPRRDHGNPWVLIFMRKGPQISADA
jgi:heme/copper-type cytochrome/quinol oxidase subunit 1